MALESLLPCVRRSSNLVDFSGVRLCFNRLLLVRGGLIVMGDVVAGIWAPVGVPVLNMSMSVFS